MNCSVDDSLWVGVVTETAYEVKKLDENYFAEDV